MFCSLIEVFVFSSYYSTQPHSCQRLTNISQILVGMCGRWLANKSGMCGCWLANKAGMCGCWLANKAGMCGLWLAYSSSFFFGLT